MNFLNPLLLIGAVGIALPILAHLLNKHQYKHTTWAAMQFLNRAVNVRSRQIKLRDLLLLILRCAAVLFLVFAISKPILERSGDGSRGGVASKFGEPLTGMVIAIDASYSMQHSDGSSTRFERAIKKAKLITKSAQPGDTVSLVMLSGEHSVVVRDMAYDRDRFHGILDGLEVTDEPLNLDSAAGLLREVLNGLDVAQREVHLITDVQEHDWSGRDGQIEKALEGLSRDASLVIVPVSGASDNLAITQLELVSGVLRKGTTARYQATVKNYGNVPVSNVMVRGGVNGINMDTKSIPSIAAGASETVSLFIPFRNAGAVQITAKLDDDALLLDNECYAVAVVRERVSILCVEGSSSSSVGFSGFISAALSARDNGASQEDFKVKSVPWVSLPNQDLARYDVVILANVPAITPGQSKQLEAYVRSGNGLVWFPGDQTKPTIWNKQSALGSVRLLPALLEDVESVGNDSGVGQPLASAISDHSVCRPLRSLSEDLLSETQFLKVLNVKPTAESSIVLALEGSSKPLLIEQSIGRGQVFMFTSSAEPTWNNMALTPVFPMLIQQMVTYLTAREFEKPRVVGSSLSLSYVDQPDSSDAVFETPKGETITVPVKEHRNQYIALLDRANEAGFYLARVSVQAPSMPIAVNIDSRESDVQCVSADALLRKFSEGNIVVASSDSALVDTIKQARTGLSFWRSLMIACFVFLIIESVIAHFTSHRAPHLNSEGKGKPSTHKSATEGEQELEHSS